MTAKKQARPRQRGPSKDNARSYLYKRPNIDALQWHRYHGSAIEGSVTVISRFSINSPEVCQRPNRHKRGSSRILMRLARQ